VLERYKCFFLLLLQPLVLPSLRGEFEQTLCLRAMKISTVLACCNISKCIQHRSIGTSFVFLHCYSFLLSLRGEFMQTLCLRVMRIGMVLACCCMLKYIQHHNFPCPHWYSYSYGLIWMISWTRECRYVSSLEMLPVSLVVLATMWLPWLQEWNNRLPFPFFPSFSLPVIGNRGLYVWQTFQFCQWNTYCCGQTNQLWMCRVETYAFVSLLCSV
jgi:hypothetical protein